MLEPRQINRLTEFDFNIIIEQAGGKRFSLDDSRESEKNVDYIFEDCLIELKIVEEEGLEKQERHEKISKLFSKYTSAPVAVIDKNYLSDEDKNKYYKILETPIKTHIKKANEQFKISCQTLSKDLKKILIIVNNGYASLDLDEFKEIVARRVKNDTSNIDYVICCGLYFYSDGFDHYAIFPFDLLKIKENQPPAIHSKLEASANQFLVNLMTEFILGCNLDNPKNAVLDVEFDYNGVTFVKPAPLFGKKSYFWVNGRPRINTTRIETCPPVGVVFPQFSRSCWNILKENLTDNYILENSYEEWIIFSNNEEKNNFDLLKPFVQIKLSEEEIKVFCKNQKASFFLLCQLATTKYQEYINTIILNSKKTEEVSVFISRYIFVRINEIGRDKKNDLASVYLISHINGVEKIEAIFENQRLFFEYAICLASSYAIKNNVDVVVYYQDKKYCWQ